jgi:hypothetical protein
LVADVENKEFSKMANSMLRRSHVPRLLSNRAIRVALLLLAAGAWPAVRSTSAAEFMFRAVVGGQTLEGKPLTWTEREMVLLGRDGRLHEFDPRDAKHAEKTAPQFAGYSMPEMKRELYLEFGDNLDVSTTQHYIVVHPRGESQAWAGRFEELYRWCIGYFRVRGFRPQEPEFPLVAIVFRNEGDYRRAASASGTPLQPNTLGHYDSISNRVFLFDVTNGNGGDDWSENAATIIHEATHQTAYNVGIHNRFAEAPRWLVEGLATMFEARGVWNSQSYHSLKDRLNAGRLSDFRARLARGRRPPGTMAALVASDPMFRRDSAGAYAEAWALTLYLCETRPRQYMDYLATTAGRAMFSEYSSSERIADFQAAFGSDLKQLEAKFLAWMAEIK